MTLPKIWQSPIFEKHTFPAENAGNMPKKPVFDIFLRFHHYFILVFCPKMCFSNAQNMTKSDFWEKNFTGRKWRNVPEFTEYQQIFIGLDFSFYFSLFLWVFFSLKTLFIAIPNTFLKSPEQPIMARKTGFLEFLEFCSIFIHEFLLFHSFVRLFFLQGLFH